MRTVLIALAWRICARPNREDSVGGTNLMKRLFVRIVAFLVVGVSGFFAIAQAQKQFNSPSLESASNEATAKARIRSGVSTKTRCNRFWSIAQMCRQK